MSDQDLIDARIKELKREWKKLIISKTGTDEETYDSYASLAGLIWEKAKSNYKAAKFRVRHTLMSFSGAASTITNELKLLRQLKKIAEDLDSIKVIMKTAVEMYADNTGWRPKVEDEDEDKS